MKLPKINIFNKISMIEANDLLAILLISVMGIVILSLFGALILMIWDYEVQGFIYNFIFGVGVLASFTFVVAIYEELKGSKNGISK